MKSLFYLLLLANLTFFLWEQFVHLEPAGTESAERSERQVDTIVLLKELPPPPVIVTKGTVAAAVEAAAQAAETPPVEPAPVQAESPLPVATSTPVEAPVQAETPLAAPAAPPTPPAVPETPQVQTEPPAASVVKPAETREFCARLGPFDAEAEAKEVGRGIEGVSDAWVESRVRPAENGYWVLRPPAASLEEAKAVKRKLLEQGAKEALILREGENANGVSLGFFRDRTRAENLLREYRAKGLDALEIRARRDGKTEYWLKVRAQADAAAWNASLERLRKQHPDLRVEEKAGCGENGAGSN